MLTNYVPIRSIDVIFVLFCFVLFHFQARPVRVLGIRVSKVYFIQVSVRYFVQWCFVHLSMATLSLHVSESGFWNPRNFCFWNSKSGKILLMESEILGFGIQNTAQGIWNPTNDRNPESKFH